MIESDFQATMTEEELVEGEARHIEFGQTTKLAMFAGRIKSSDQLR